jgi:hypothetical protein
MDKRNYQPDDEFEAIVDQLSQTLFNEGANNVVGRAILWIVVVKL